MYKYPLLLLLILFSVVKTIARQPAGACTIELRGTIVDSDNGKAVEGATVVALGSAARGMTDKSGSFMLSGLCRGSLVLEISSLGYTTHKHRLNVSSNTRVTLSLHADNIELNEVEVKGHRKSVNAMNNSEEVSGEQLERTRGASLAGALKDIAGVSMLQTGATIAKPVIHGLHSNRILVLNNGIRQEGQQWGSEHAPEIDPFIANKLTVIKGSEGIRYGGDAVAGVILVEPAALQYSKRLEGQVNTIYSQNGRSGVVAGMLGGSIGKLAWRAQGSAKRGGNLRTADYYLDNTGIKELNYSGTLGYSNKIWDTELYYSHFSTELAILKDSHIGNINDLQTRIEYGRPFFDGDFSYKIAAPMQKVYHDLLKWKAHIHLNNNIHLNATYAYQNNNRQEYDQRRVLTGTPTLYLKLRTHTLDVNMEHMSDRGWKKIVGLAFIDQVNNNVAGTGVTPLIPNYDSYSAAAYGIVKKMMRTWEAEAGVRYEYKHLDALGYNRNKELYGGVRNFSNIAASVGAVKHFNNHWHLRSNLGMAWRPPVVSELYSNGLHHGTASYEIGDSTLNSERSVKWLTSLEHQSERLTFTWDAYVNLIQDFIYLQPAGEYFENIRGAFPVYNYRQTNARLLGTDISASYRITDALSYRLKYSMIRGRDTKNDTWLPWFPADRISNTLRYELPAWKKAKNNYIEAGHQYTARQTRYEANSDYVVPPAAYNLFSLAAGSRLQLGKNTLDLNISADNLFDTLYKDYLNRFRYFAHDLGRNITVRATWKF